MRKIIVRLAPKLKAKWRDNADRILCEEGRAVCIEDISPFGETKSRSLSIPIFGKLPCLEKETRISKEKRAKSKPDKLDENHNPTDCPPFAKVPNQELVDFVMKQRLYFACLRGGHQSRGCHKKKPCSHCHGRHATVMHVHLLEDKHSHRKLEVSSETPVQSSENISQESISRSNLEQRSAEPCSAEHFCGLTSLEGSVAALPIVPVKIKVKGNPRCIETYALLLA